MENTQNHRKIIAVAVHGVGDQTHYATVQQVADQFTRYFGTRLSIPFGHFGGFDGSGNSAYFPPAIDWLGFAEVYWANIARGVATDGYVLEETKEWATTVGRRAIARQKSQYSRVDYHLVGNILGEMVDTIATLEDLTFLADKAGIGSFDLKKILVDYVDDVQIVAEFPNYRTNILTRFRTTLSNISQNCPDAEIYIVAHSEGTAISFLGLLEALWANPTPAWVKQVRGLMTFGSPINKHLVLWPELFLGASAAFVEDDIVNLDMLAGKLMAPSPDPVSQYILNQLSANTRLLLAHYTSGPSAPLQEAIVGDLNTIIQSGPLERSLFSKVNLSFATDALLKQDPKGEDSVRCNRMLVQDAYAGIIANNRVLQWSGAPTYNPDRVIKWRNYYDYGDPVGYELDLARDWLNSKGVTAFEFEGNEAGKTKPNQDIGFARYPLPGEAHEGYWTDPDVFDHFIESAILGKPNPAVPGSKAWVWIVSYIVSYGAAFALLIVGIFLVYHSLGTYATGADSKLQPASTIHGALHEVGDVLGIAALLAGVTVLARMPRLVNSSQVWFWNFWAVLIFGIFAAGYGFLVSPSVQTAVSTLPGWIMPEAGLASRTAATILIAMLLAIGSAWVSRKLPQVGMKPLIVWGGATLLVIIVQTLNTPSTNSEWPIWLASAGLLYLWWLAGLLFDLVFVWHRYIRHGFSIKFLRGATK